MKVSFNVLKGDRIALRGPGLLRDAGSAMLFGSHRWHVFARASVTTIRDSACKMVWCESGPVQVGTGALKASE